MKLPMVTRKHCILIFIISSVVLTGIIALVLFLSHTKYHYRTYTLVHNWNADAMFNGNDWIFETNSPTTLDKGFMTYVNKSLAVQQGLFKLGNNSLYLGAKQTDGRPNSVRIYTTQTFTGGLVLIDSTHLPSGCGTWPSFWTLGSNWPNNGEIDIMEGINGHGNNTVSLHTSSGCTMPITSNFTDCSAPNVGCESSMNSTVAYGDTFNDIGGGVYAMEWQSSNDGGIRVWFFQRNAIPIDIANEKPDPPSWPTNQTFRPENKHTMLLSALLLTEILFAKSVIKSYRLKENYEPHIIFNGIDWVFDTGEYNSPKQGFMNYTSREDAIQNETFKLENNTLYIGAKQHPNGGPPSSVRLITNNSYTGGLWLFDSDHIPDGCGSWPSFWSVGPKWPSNGEIDIMEGINGYGNDTVSVHTSPGCCANKIQAPFTFGSSFNSNQGGVYAMEWVPNASGWIKVWFFPRGRIPSDITHNTPNPSSWPTDGAYAEFRFGTH
ncbi:hypothetical protein HDV04_000288 [Boothiomyces sp. JEL0838]|nr:hypothetical protein HDV04_000288 [Boothiomyces sp. JEL0838]